jgi:hypothetical protein
MNDDAAPGAGPPSPDNLPVPIPPPPLPGGYSLETIDVTRLSELLAESDAEDSRTKALGEAIIKALITDILRAKLGFGGATEAYWSDGWGRESGWGRGWDRATHVLPEVRKVVDRLIAGVSLSAAELAVVEQLDIELED